MFELYKILDTRGGYHFSTAPSEALESEQLDEWAYYVIDVGSEKQYHSAMFNYATNCDDTNGLPYYRMKPLTVIEYDVCEEGIATKHYEIVESFYSHNRTNVESDLKFPYKLYFIDLEFDI
jgi:hypothetical protein